MRLSRCGWLSFCLAGAALAQPPAAPGGATKGPLPVIASATLAKSDAEKRALAVLNELSEKERRGALSVPLEDGRLLRVLVESAGAKCAVELGTSIGYSGLWMCLGLRATGGHLTTYEIDPGRAAQARENFRRAGVDDLVTVVEGDAHARVAEFKGEIDLVFLDADKEGYLDYFNKLLPSVKPGGVIVAHNMTPRMADPRFLQAITTNPDLETVFVNKETSGVGITLKKR